MKCFNDYINEANLNATDTVKYLKKILSDMTANAIKLSEIGNSPELKGTSLGQACFVLSHEIQESIKRSMSPKRSTSKL